MRNLLKNMMLTTLLILGLGGLSFAFTAVNTGKITPNTQKSLTGFVTQALGQTSGNVETAQATVITGLMVNSGSTVDIVGLYDWSANNLSGTEGAAPNSSCIFEASSAANTSTFYDFSNAPIRTLNGLEAAQSQTTGGFIVYTVQQM